MGNLARIQTIVWRRRMYPPQALHRFVTCPHLRRSTMPNVSGARNVYGSRTLVGNWTEDAAGAALAAHLARSTPRTGASEASAAYRAPPPDAAPAEPAPPPLDTLRVGLLMPHGPNIVKPPPGEPDTRHTSLAAAAARGVPDGGAGKDAAPGEGRRTDLIRARELRVRARGRGRWRTGAGGAPATEDDHRCPGARGRRVWSAWHHRGGDMGRARGVCRPLRSVRTRSGCSRVQRQPHTTPHSARLPASTRPARGGR